MNRGILGSFLDDGTYSESSKVWGVELTHSQMYWYELIQNRHDEIDTKSIIYDQVKLTKKQVEDNLEKRFIYFICSRVKVRFCNETPPVPTPFYGYIKLRVLVGRALEPKEFIVKELYDSSGEIILPEIDESGKFITFVDHYRKHKTVLSVHDFLLNFNINLGFDTEVHYVGYTKNPNTRPLNRIHGGLSGVLYSVSNEENDILIYFNLFKVISTGVESKYGIEYNIANAMIDEVNVEIEGRILEKAFLFYFDAKNQNENRKSEKTELINNMNHMKSKGIDGMQIYYEVDGGSEYYRFCSSSVEASYRHLFSIDADGGELNLTHGAPLFEQHLVPSENMYNKQFKSDS